MFYLFFICMCIGVLPAHMLGTTCMKYTVKNREGLNFSREWKTDSCDCYVGTGN